MPNPDRITVNECGPESAEHFAVVAETAAQMHWPSGIPVGVRRILDDLWVTSRAAHTAGAMVAVVLLHEGAEGVDGHLETIAVDEEGNLIAVDPDESEGDDENDDFDGTASDSAGYQDTDDSDSDAPWRG